MIACFLQISWLEITPEWLPPVAIIAGYFLVTVAITQQYIDALFENWSDYPISSHTAVISLSLSIGGATYITIHTHDLVLLFIFFVFISGRLIQGAITARFLQKVLDFLFSKPSESEVSYIKRMTNYIITKLKERAILFFIVGFIFLHTSLSIAAVYVIGSGELMEAIERFWVGFFFLIVTGMVFDFRYFAHRISWTAAIGLVIAVTGAFLYNPVGFSTFSGALEPYIQNPIPDWMRWPLGAIGFVFGVVLWAVFYIKEG